MSELITGKYAGFCFGVKRAVDCVTALIENASAGERIYTLGELVHNPRVLKRLSDAGVIAANEADIDEIFESCTDDSPCTVVMRAHGSTREVAEKLEAYSREKKSFHVVDCTCPYVKKIHNIVDENTKNGECLLVMGDADHPEVLGIVSHAKGESAVFRDISELNTNNYTEKCVIIVAQTTQNLSEWHKTQELLRNHLTNLQIYDTICCVTENRQKEVERLASEVDLMLIIGGRSSSNTRKLLNVSKSVLEHSFLIEDAGEITPQILALAKSANKIGITAGASTPSDIIQEVKTTMSEKLGNEFEELLEESLKTLNTGDIVSGTITSITPTDVHVDLSANVTGLLPYEEIANAETPYQVGDTIEAFVVRVSDLEGVAGLSRKRIERIDSWKRVVAAHESGEILEGKITKIIKGGCMIALGAIEAFIPASHTGIPKGEELTPLKGTMQKVKIIEIDQDRSRATASIRAVLRAERKEAVAKLWAELEVGKKFTGTVKSITSFGAFVDIGGVDGMVHITELSWSRIKSPADVVKVGDSIDVFIKSFDPQAKRISLGCKTEETNPWNIFMNSFNIGDVVSAKIVGITPFGAFAEIIPEVDGLIHISQIADHKIATPAEVVHLDDVVQVKIINIDTEKKKISLSMRALLEDQDEEAPLEDEDDGQ